MNSVSRPLYPCSHLSLSSPVAEAVPQVDTLLCETGFAHKNELVMVPFIPTLHSSYVMGLIPGGVSW